MIPFKQLVHLLKSRFSMRPTNTGFIDNGGWNISCEYADKFGQIWLAPYPFYPWSDRVKQSKKSPCNFDHNGECLVCDCWPSECAWQRYLKEDYRWETKEELEEMFKEQINHGQDNLHG
jgi:hypothetical protein